MTGWSSTPTEAQPIPSGRRAHGRVRVPSSKSITHRYLNLALLARRPLIVERPLLAEDTRLFLAALARCGWLVEALRRLGAEIRYRGRPDHVPLEIAGGTLAGGATRLDAGESSQFLSALLMAGL